MVEATTPAGHVNATLKALCRALLGKGNLFNRGPSYEGHGAVLSSVEEAVRIYETLGYSKLLVFGHPLIYAVLERGDREVHIFQIQDPQMSQWLENNKATLNEPAIRAYLLAKAGLQESDMIAASKPRRFHLNEVDNVFIATTNDTD